MRGVTPIFIAAGIMLAIGILTVLAWFLYTLYLDRVERRLAARKGLYRELVSQLATRDRALLEPTIHQLSTLYDLDALEAVLEEGLVAEAALETAVTRVLRLKERLGLFDDAPAEPAADGQWPSARARETGVLAERAARQAVIVLEDGGHLPLSARRIAAVGPNADDLDALLHADGEPSTFVLFTAIPMLMLAQAFPVLAAVAQPLGWALALWGLLLYWWSGVLYARQAVRVVRNPPRGAGADSDTLNVLGGG